jgi:error-prone DNA polymerase
MAAICEKLVQGMKKNGIAEDIALRIYNQINAFADYGFPESHAASFALIVYASAYLRHYYAPEFTAAILNAQPMGFYSVGTLIEDARRHGVEVRPVDLTCSAWETTLELSPLSQSHEASSQLKRHEAITAGRLPESRKPRRSMPAVRLGLRLVRGLGSRARDKLEDALSYGPFTSIADVVRRSGLDRRSLRLLAEAGAFDAMLPEEADLKKRRAALWKLLEEVRGEAGPLAPSSERAVPRNLPPMTRVQMTEADYRVTGLSLNGHPMKHIRGLLQPNGVLTASEVHASRDGDRVGVAGLVICRQRPGTAKGFVFLTLEDETGMVNVVVTPKRYERDALLIATSPLLMVRGTLQIEERVVNLRGEVFRTLTDNVGAGWAGSHDFH